MRKDSSVENTLVKINSDTVLPRKKFEEDAIGAWYVLLDANAGSPDSTRLKNWLASFTNDLIENGIDPGKNLFQRGSGPMGAQVDPDADLLIAVYSNKKMDKSSINFHANDFDLHPDYQGYLEKENHSLAWFVLSKRSWQVMRHLPSLKEITEICKQQNMNEKDWINNSCTTVHISFNAKAGKEKISFDKYFLASFTR